MMCFCSLGQRHIYLLPAVYSYVSILYCNASYAEPKLCLKQSVMIYCTMLLVSFYIMMIITMLLVTVVFYLDHLFGELGTWAWFLCCGPR
jgi:hypothetical protein